MDAKNLLNKEFAELAGIKSQTLTSYLRGQALPNAKTLAAWKQKIGINIDWLLTGEGQPFADTPPEPLETLNGKLAGDLLFDLLLALFGSWEQAGEALGIPPAEAQAMAGLHFAPTWDTLRRLAAVGVSVDFLLRGEGPDLCPATQLDRVRTAIGTWNDGKLSEALGLGPNFGKAFSEARENNSLDPDWLDTLAANYQLNPGWIRDPSAPMLVKRPHQQDSAPSTSQPAADATTTDAPTAANLPALLDYAYDQINQAAEAEAERNGTASDHYLALVNLRAAVNDCRNWILHGRKPAPADGQPTTQVAREVAELREQLGLITENQSQIFAAIREHLGNRPPDPPEQQRSYREPRARYQEQGLPYRTPQPDEEDTPDSKR